MRPAALAEPATGSHLGRDCHRSGPGPCASTCGNIGSRRPGQHAAADRRRVAVEYNYFDLASKGKPSASFLYSNRWNTDVGEFGVLVDVAYQKHAYRRDEISTEPFYEIQASPDSAQTNYPGYDGKTLYVPHGGDIGQAGGDRRRLGTVVALQWRPNDDVELYAQGFRSAYKFLTHATSYAVYTGDSPIIPDASQPFSFDPNGNFLSGTFNGTGDGNGGVTDGVGVDSNASLTQRYSVTTDLSLGGSWNVTNNLTLTTDLQYTKATTKETNVILDMGTRTPYLFQDISGRTPTLQVPAGYTTNPANNTYSWLLDNKDRSTGNEFAWRADAEYTLGGDFFRSIKAGVRTTNRRAVTDSTNYSHFVTLGQPLSDYPDSTWVTTSYGNFFRGESNTFGSILSPNPAELADYPDSLPTYGINSLLQYTPSGRNNQGEKTYAAYGVLRFGWDMGNIPVDGNVGMRAVQTKVDSSGFRNEPGNSGRLLPLDVSQSYNSYLPSLNLSVHLTPDLQWRLAASKAISRPNFSDMNPNLSLNVADANSATPSYTGAAGNPNLKPMTAKQYDTSLEWYYGRGSLLYGDLFYKNVSGFIANTVFNESYDSHAYQVSRPVNGGDGIIKGAEIGWQTFFDFLPAPFDGLGLQTNYTYVYSAAPSPGATDTSGNTLTVPLEGLSKNSYNVIAMYEKGPFQARIAYNWRSLWVITTQGVGSGNLPEYNKAYGQVDVSATYEINDHFQLTASAVNLANAHTDIQSGLHGRPRHLQIDDRQFTLKAQLSF
ncbi:TonB-dependent receptor [Rhodanobacter ginsenosidimutans]|uniref:TonB-dependent receptor n=1 Tax=Rhodanobacter ginsenosidimutans TaxID=490571 RepID=A0ABW0JUY8_9GAMM